MNSSLRAGQVESVRRVLQQADFDRFAAISGDDNLIHVDPVFAARTKFGGTVAHGMLLYSIVSGVVGTRLPGPGTIQLAHELIFPNPTYSGAEVTAQVEVIGIEHNTGLANLATAIVRPDGRLGLEGRTLVRLPGTSASALPALESLPAAPVAPEGDGFKGLVIGQRAETRRAFGPKELEEYVDLTGDANPLFHDMAYARRLGFAGPLVPGGLLGGMLSFLLGTRLPGQGTNYLKQRLEFLEPAYTDQELIAIVEITRLRPEKQLVNLATRCMDPKGAVVCRGESLVLVSDVEELKTTR